MEPPVSSATKQNKFGIDWSKYNEHKLARLENFNRNHISIMHNLNIAKHLDTHTEDLILDIFIVCVMTCLN